jgi:asparagine synthase (glutamine-hydrolysing)
MFQWKNCFLAHERLAIIDPASGDQPLFNEDKSVSVCVNGEIYNYKVCYVTCYVTCCSW